MPILKHLSKPTISKGYEVLNLIGDIMGSSNRSVIEELSGEFYSIIPHDFSKKRLSEYVIDSREKLRRKLEMVKELEEIDPTSTRENAVFRTQNDFLYTQYVKLRCELVPIETNSTDFAMIGKYIENTSAHFACSEENIVEIFKVATQGEDERFNKYSGTKKRMLLWHGSPLQNFVSILSQGLRSPAGRGTYLADMSGKSFVYCRSTGIAILLLCEVALANSKKIKGSLIPNLSESQVLEDGLIVPLGKPLQNRRGLGFNEYIV